jgi:hypothetical protein
LPAGTSSFINANIGTPEGQQAILQAGLSLGLSQAQIASAVSQATGMTVTPQQVAQVAQSAPASAPAPAAPQFVGTPAPGAVGTSYGQASGGQISSVQQSAPDLAIALQNGTAKMTYDGEGTPYLYDAKTGQQITGNYQIQVGQNGQLGINMPSGNGSMVQVATKMNQDGSLAPVNASNVLNVGVNKGAGGFAGGVGALGTIVGGAAAIIAPELIPFIAAYNSADAASKGQYGRALLNAGISYAGFNPDSALVQAVKNGVNIPTDASGQPTLDSTQPVSGATTSPVYSPDVTGTPLSSLDANAPVAPVTNAGTPISQVGNVANNSAWNGTVATPNGAPIDTTGLNQNFGSGAITDTNLAGMNTAYTNAMANGGFTSGYQTLPDGSKVMIQNDGTAIQTNPTTGQTTSLDANQVRTLVNNGTLNSSSSGYNAATGGTNIAPGGGTINSNGTTTLPNGGTVTTPLNSVAPTTNALGLTPVQTAAGLIGGAAVAGNLSTNSAIANAANAQNQAGQNVNTVLGDFYNSYKQSQQPYQQTGVQATNALGSLGSGTYNIMNPDGTIKSSSTGNDYLTHQFNAADLKAGLAPNYDFMLQQGQGSNRNLANVGGGLLSGNTLQGLNKYTQDYAGNAYQQAFNNYQTQRQNIYNNLAGQAGIGQTSLSQLGSVGANLANTYGNITTGLAASQAGATTAQAVNNSNTLNTLAKTGALLALA